MDTSILTKASATLAAVVSIGGALWVFGDDTGYRPWLKKEMNNFTAHDFKVVMDQTQLNSQLLAKFDYEKLTDPKRATPLTFEDKMAICKDVQILGYSVADAAGNQFCTKDGQPVITFKAPVK